MNVRLTANPAKAGRLISAPKATRLDVESGDQFTRAMPRVGDLDEESRTFRAVVATATPVKRQDAKGAFLEVLDPAGLIFDPSDDLPLLTDHKQSARETVGRVSGLTIDGPSVSATLRIGMADDIEPIFQRVKDGTVRHVSAGYQVLAWSESRNPDGTRIKTAIRWRLSEVSLVPVPADRNAIIHRSAEMPFDLETRAALIETLRSACNLPDTWGEDLSEEAVTDEEVREAAREAMLTRQAPRIRVRQDHTDPAQIQTRAAGALAFRMAGGDLPDASREFVGMSLRELAADSLQRSGVSTRGLSADDIFTRASHGTSDFPLLVSNAIGKVAAQAYQAAESPLKALARQRTLPNFKTSTSIRLGEMGRLEEMTEHGEFKHTSRAEAGEVMSLKTFGRAINVSRKLLIDDDLGLLGDMTAAMGQAAAQTEAEELVALLTGNPKLSDGKAVFHASRGNLASGPEAELTEEGLSVARQHMRTVKGLDGKTIIDAKPKHLVVGPVMETLAEKLLSKIYAASIEDAPVFAGKLQLVVEPRLSAQDWFLLADPARVPSLQYGYLAAAQGVQIQRQEAWDTLGLKFRAWLDFGCGWLDWRGAYRATGI
ncbi:Mu-like prophage major head subunit gpT family protein [Cereibacter azotoformans]|uniref:HK97 family phage prohead protease n=1 Tax=Cereibacter azotoformans TaxID=43057 RepID=A0A2T5JPV8_9RHOB|nr:Mu-like prophage major head subunit gpT family protein [Cereibacter azotoformans]AXQ95682.1 peptidase [Cereibacter sphaeroides]PTR09682.1 HK97 family phage prohead protease [Cereibacter azotoformans]UIJ32822.1 Mu-like prophage major head subunit gpT family protein [Cereibacter azotoformans]